MTTYIITFSTERHWAQTRLTAETPEQALAEARRFAEDDGFRELDYQNYDEDPFVEQIEVHASGDAVAEWRHPRLLVRLAAHDLLNALEAQTTEAQAVIDAWEQGDLAGAVRMLDASIPAARAAIAKAKTGTG